MRKSPLFAALLTCIVFLSFAFAIDKDKEKDQKRNERGSLRVVQISDLHLGLRTHPEGEEHARQAIDLVNSLHPDLVLVSGDMSENKTDAREEASELLKRLKAPYKTVPGNHDVHDDDMSAYRGTYGDDYYSFEMRGLRFIGLNSQLMGNFDSFDAKEPVRNAGKAAGESDKMFAWLASLPATDQPTFVFQHVPITREGAPDDKQYWAVSNPYLNKEIDQLKRLHVKHVFAGHWHNPQTRQRDGITVHVAPAVSYGIKTDAVGIVLYTIDPSGDVKSEVMSLRVAQ